MSVERQGSILSNLSDFDILDVVPDDEVDFYQGGAGDGFQVPLGIGQNFLHKNREIFVKITVRETHGITADVLGSTRLYDIDCTHSGYKWRIVRKYGHFEELHRALRFYRASLMIGMRANHTASAIALPSKGKREEDPPPAPARRRKVGRVQRKISLRFPNKPEIFISSPSQVERRRRRLEQYLNAVLKDPTYRTHEATMRFLEISQLSFAKHKGEKFHEGYILKRSGGRRFSTLLGCFAPSTAVWNRRWLVLKDSYICYLRQNQEIADVMLFDQDFYEVKRGLASTRIKHGLIITNMTRELALKTTSHHKRDNWVLAITQAAESCEYTKTTPNNSFAPQRKELAHWYVDAASYFADVASALENAQEEIFITDWWLSPELFLRRPVVHMTDPSRLDQILLKKAEEGVKIYILLYKEIEMAVGGIQSFKCKTYLESLHPNILVMRHPDHLKSLVYLWTHHEKIVCVDQTIAFLGGLDLCYGRWDDSLHRLTDVGSVQSVTPPVSRPVSTVIVDDWKGIGSADLKHKATRKKLNNRSVIESQATFLVAQALPERLRRPSPRSLSASDFIELKKKGKTTVQKTYSADICNLKGAQGRPSREFRFGAAGVLFSHSTTVLEDSDKMVDTDGEEDAVDSLFKMKLHVSDEDVFVSANMAEAEWNYNNKPLAVNDITTDSANQQSDVVVHSQVQAQPLPRIGSDVIIDSPTEDARPPLTTGDVKSSLPFGDAAKSLDENSSFDLCQMNSITSADLFLPFTRSVPLDERDAAFSTGFGDTVSLERVNTDVPQPNSLEDKRSLCAGTTSIPLLSLEPIRGFRVDLDEVRRKKSWGKVPNPPLKYALAPQLDKDGKELSPKKKESRGFGRPPKEVRQNMQMVTKELLEKRKESKSSKQDMRVTKESTEPKKDSKEKKKEFQELKREMRERRREARYARESVSVPTNESHAGGAKSWKKLRNSMDKIKRVLKHENSQFDMNMSRKSSSASVHEVDRATKYWLGKDYVNWIYKDLDSADAPYTDLVDRLTTVRMPWHDIACVVFNKAATDVGRHFIQRWNYAKKVKSSSKQSGKYPLLLPRSTSTSYKRLPPFIKDMCELVNCQILRSCSGWSSGMQRPEHSIYNAYIELIEHAQHYIYIENQFFISWCGTDIQNCICEALVNRIVRAHQSGEKLRVYLVLPLLPAFEADLDPQKSRGSALYSVLYWIQQSLVSHENSLFRKLRGHGLDPSDYVSVCGLRKHGSLQGKPVTELIYVHSKLMIVDDRRCIIGSANINDRSLAGDRDSEIAVLIEDELFLDSKMSGQDFQAGKFCYSLRNTLFQEHLGLRDTEYIQDVTCDEFYKHKWVTTAAINTSIYKKVFNCLPCDTVSSFAELRMIKALNPLATTNPVVAKQQLLKVRGHLVMYPLEFLKNEKLINHLGTKEKMMPSTFWT